MTDDLQERAQQYRKTALITATQWFKMGDHPAVVKYNDEQGWITTLEGGHIVTPGDWIATGVKGEHWPIKPDIFAATYEPAFASPTPEPSGAVVREALEGADYAAHLAIEKGIEQGAVHWRKGLELVQELCRTALASLDAGSASS